MSQHTPSAQKPVWHWSFVVQAVPCESRGLHSPAGAQYVAFGSAQSDAVTQSAQAPPTHFCGAQSSPPVAAAQLPAPRQTLPTALLPLHTFAPGEAEQSVPAAQIAHARLPSHAPFCPQVCGVSRAH